MADLARYVGIPLKFDQNTEDGELGHLSRVIIDFNLAFVLRCSIILNKEGRVVNVCFFFYKNLLDFCSAGSSVGHVTANCQYLEKHLPYASEKKSVSHKGKEKQVYQPKLNILGLNGQKVMDAEKQTKNRDNLSGDSFVSAKMGLTTGASSEIEPTKNIFDLLNKVTEEPNNSLIKEDQVLE